MNRRFISVLLFAFVVAAGASIVLYRLVVARMTAAAPAATSAVLVASRNLELGSVISDADFRVAAWPGAPPQGSVVRAADALGRGIAAPIYASEPITESRLGARGAGGGLAATIPAGMRAVAIRVNEIVGVAGFVVTGSHVDVLVSGVAPETMGAPGGNVTRTLLQNITVLSAGQDFKKDTEGKPVSVPVVNLLVTPDQAEMLSLAGAQMTIQLVLRNPLDKAITNTPEITSAGIFSGQAPVAIRRPQASSAAMPRQASIVTLAAAPLPEPPRMEIISGAKRTEVALQRVDAR